MSASVLAEWVDRRQCYPDTDDFLRGRDLLEFVRNECGNVVTLSFSRGKDSIAAWLYLRENDFEIVPFTMYAVPGLGYQERVTQYYEDFFGVHIQRLPHPDFYWRLCNEVWQLPDQIAVVAALDLLQYDFELVEDLVAEDAGLKESFCAWGMRRADNRMRRRLIDQTGVVGFRKRHFFYPIWDWKIKDVAEILQRYNASVSIEYDMFGYTSDRIYYQRLAAIRDFYPKDYAKILEWFPLAEAEIFRYEGIP